MKPCPYNLALFDQFHIWSIKKNKEEATIMWSSEQWNQVVEKLAKYI